jgi:8-oxo-dGTP pyrophosphatase MutT (NUDIX family)
MTTVAAGILFKSQNGRILLCRRTDGLGWAFPGGVQKEGETIEGCAIRECLEEVAYNAGHVGPLLSRRIKDGVDFSTFMHNCPDEFVPKLNHEHDAHVWISPDHAYSLNLHPGCDIALRKMKGMNELEIAEAIRDQELTSPQFVENVCLVDMRISGTGFSYRPKLNEWVYRRDTVYLTPEFLRRCSGIPIILDHPVTQILNSDEFSKRVVGTMFVPYVKGDEVWGVAKIYDKLAINAVTNMQLSTSPSVVFRDTKVNYNIEMEDGSNLLVEGKPSFVDHLAICEKGVWDKGGDASGIRIDSEETGEAREKVVTAKLDGEGPGELPAPSLPPQGVSDVPAPPMQGIPPGLVGLADNMSRFAERLDKFMARRDLMIR